MKPGRILGNPLLKERIHDPYHTRLKLREATSCPQCGLRYRNGRWSTAATGAASFRKLLCPACRRINDNYPAAELSLSGAFLHSHRVEIISRIRNVEKAERAEHPLNRIMDIEDDDGMIRITTTDLHLPRRIAHALKDAFGGESKTHYDRAGHFARFHWSREQ